jgi:hypothetical protein
MRYFQDGQSPNAAIYWQKALIGRIPNAALEYVAQLMRTFKMELHLSSPRVSKLGHYRVAHQGKPQSISINRDLSQERFLLTLVHELAHLVCHNEFGRHIKPHGSEWKRTFQTLMTPLLCEPVFSAAILPHVIRHLNTPKATSCVDKELHMAFERMEGKEYITLDDIETGTEFTVRKGRRFVKGERKRTRYLCAEIPSGKGYLIHGSAEVTPANAKKLVSQKIFDGYEGE